MDLCPLLFVILAMALSRLGEDGEDEGSLLGLFGDTGQRPHWHWHLCDLIVFDVDLEVDVSVCLDVDLALLEGDMGDPLCLLVGLSLGVRVLGLL